MSHVIEINKLHSNYLNTYLFVINLKKPRKFSENKHILRRMKSKLFCQFRISSLRD
jgi:hypothetical protein